MRLVNLNLTEVCNAEIDVFKITGLASKNEIEYGELVSGGTYDAYETDDCFQPGVAIDGIREFHIMSGEGDIKSVDQDWHYAVDNVSRVIFSVIRNGKRFVVNEPLGCYIKEYDGRIVFDVTEFAKQAGYSEEIVKIPVNKSIWCYETPHGFVYGTGNGAHFYRASASFESGDFYFEDGEFTVDGETVSELHWQYHNDFSLEKAEHPENNRLLDKVCACSSNELLIKLKPREGAYLEKVFLTTNKATYCYIPDSAGGFRKLNFTEDFFVPALTEHAVCEKDYYKYLIHMTQYGYFIDYAKLDNYWDGTLCDFIIICAPGAMLFKNQEVRCIKVWATAEDGIDIDYNKIDFIFSEPHQYSKPMDLIAVSEILNSEFYGEFSMSVYTCSDEMQYKLGNDGDWVGCYFEAKVGNEEVRIEPYIEPYEDNWPDPEDVNKIFHGILNSENLASIDGILKKSRILGLDAEFGIVRKTAGQSISYVKGNKHITIPLNRVPERIDLTLNDRMPEFMKNGVYFKNEYYSCLDWHDESDIFDYKDLGEVSINDYKTDSLGRYLVYFNPGVLSYRGEEVQWIEMYSVGIAGLLLEDARLSELMSSENNFETLWELLGEDNIKVFGGGYGMSLVRIYTEKTVHQFEFQQYQIYSEREGKDICEKIRFDWILDGEKIKTTARKRIEDSAVTWKQVKERLKMFMNCKTSDEAKKKILKLRVLELGENLS